MSTLVFLFIVFTMSKFEVEKEKTAISNVMTCRWQHAETYAEDKDNIRIRCTNVGFSEVSVFKLKTSVLIK